MNRLLRILHRNGGVVLSAFLIFLAVSGVLLNHSQDLRLDATAVPAWIAVRYYRSEPVTGFEVESNYFYRVGSTLFMNSTAVETCQVGPVGAIKTTTDYVIACDDELILLTEDGTLIERLGASHGVPAGITSLGFSNDVLQLHLPVSTVAFDLNTLTSRPVLTRVPTAVTRPAPGPVPLDLLMQESVSLEQVILDLHSGRFFGSVGVWVADAVAVLLILLSLSGIKMFISPRRRTARHRRHL